MKKPKPDIQIENHFSLFMFYALTEAGLQWLKENTDGQWLGHALAVEPRYARDLADGAIADGLVVV